MYKGLHVGNFFGSAGLILLSFLFFSSCSVFSPSIIDHQNKTIQWSGLEWYVKESIELQGPGPNYFSSESKSVWVDEKGFLHMTIRKDGEKWLCSEVISRDFFGYGQYTFEVASRVDTLDPNSVVGFFTWRPSGGRYNNEIDIELSRWGKIGGPNGQFVIQPHYLNYNLHRFYFNQQGDYTSHQFIWLPFSVYFRSFHGHSLDAANSNLIEFWHANRGRVPRPKKTQIRVNFWLNDPQGLLQGVSQELIIKRFSYIPISELD